MEILFSASNHPPSSQTFKLLYFLLVQMICFDFSVLCQKNNLRQKILVYIFLLDKEPYMLRNQAKILTNLNLDPNFGSSLLYTSNLYASFNIIKCLIPTKIKASSWIFKCSTLSPISYCIAMALTTYTSPISLHPIDLSPLIKWKLRTITRT